MSKNQEFLKAAEKGDIEKLWKLWEGNPEIDINFQGEDGKTALHLAVSSNNRRAVKWLLDEEAKANLVDKDGNTALFWVGYDIQDTDTDNIAKMLIKHGADPDTKNYQGESAKDKNPKLIKNALQLIQSENKLVQNVLREPRKTLLDRKLLADTSALEGRDKIELEALQKALKAGRKEARFEFLQGAVERLKHAFPIKEGKYDPDCVPVKIKEYDGYIGEVFDGRQRNSSTGQKLNGAAPPMNDEELAARRAIVEDGVLKRPDGSLVSTEGFENKDIAGVQGFVLSKEGDLYLFNLGKADGRMRGDENIYSFHGMVLGEQPVEMAGIMRVENGKVTAISATSGHYRPDALDMYRAVEVLQEQGVLAADCSINPKHVEGGEIDIPDDLEGKPLQEFRDEMEKKGRGGLELTGKN